MKELVLTGTQVIWLLGGSLILMLFVFWLGLITGYWAGRNSAGHPFYAIANQKPFDVGEKEPTELDDFSRAELGIEEEE